MQVVLTTEAEKLDIRCKSLLFRQVTEARIAGIGRTFVGFVITDVTPIVEPDSMSAREEELVEVLVEVPNSNDLNACRELAAKRLHGKLTYLGERLQQHKTRRAPANLA